MRGMHVTHNMSDCRKYEKDRTRKKGFGKAKQKSTAMDKKTTNAYMQLTAKIAKLKRVSKKLKESSTKCKCDYDSNSGDSNST
jgi:hypothetical protein